MWVDIDSDGCIFDTIDCSHSCIGCEYGINTCKKCGNTIYYSDLKCEECLTELNETKEINNMSKFLEFNEKINNLYKDEIDRLHREQCSRSTDMAIRVIAVDALHAVNYLLEQVPYKLDEKKYKKETKELKDKLFSFFLTFYDETKK